VTREEYTTMVLDLLEKLGIDDPESVHTIKLSTDVITVGRKGKRNRLGDYETVIEQHFWTQTGAPQRGTATE